jgi:hypothetical protein
MVAAAGCDHSDLIRPPKRCHAVVVPHNKIEAGDLLRCSTLPRVGRRPIPNKNRWSQLLDMTTPKNCGLSGRVSDDSAASTATRCQLDLLEGCKQFLDLQLAMAVQKIPCVCSPTQRNRWRCSTSGRSPTHNEIEGGVLHLCSTNKLNPNTLAHKKTPRGRSPTHPKSTAVFYSTAVPTRLDMPTPNSLL